MTKKYSNNCQRLNYLNSHRQLKCNKIRMSWTDPNLLSSKLIKIQQKELKRRGGRKCFRHSFNDVIVCVFSVQEKERFRSRLRVELINLSHWLGIGLPPLPFAASSSIIRSSGCESMMIGGFPRLCEVNRQAKFQCQNQWENTSDTEDIKETTPIQKFNSSYKFYRHSSSV